MSEKLTRKQVLFGILAIAIMSVAAVSSMLLEREAALLLLKEGGIIETASAIGYFLCIAFLFYMGRSQSLQSHWYLYLILLAMMLRELDFDKRFTDPGILQSRFLTADTVGIFGKIIGLSIVLLLVISLIKWISRHGKDFFYGVINWYTRSWVVGIALALVVTSKSLDGLARKLEPLGILVPEQLNELATRFEEVFELGISIAIFYAIYLYWKPNRS